MSVSSTRTITIVYTGDTVGTESPAAATNAASPEVSHSIPLHLEQTPLRPQRVVLLPQQ